MDVLSGVRLVGPLVPFAQGFAEELTRLGFTPLSARVQLRLVMCLSRWLAEAGLDASALDGTTVDAFLVARRAAGYTTYLTPKALELLLAYLRRLGAAPQVSSPTPPAGPEGLLAEFRRYLLVERGLSAVVACDYVGSVRPASCCRASHFKGSPV